MKQLSNSLKSFRIHLEGGIFDNIRKAMALLGARAFRPHADRMSAIPLLNVGWNTIFCNYHTKTHKHFI